MGFELDGKAYGVEGVVPKKGDESLPERFLIEDGSCHLEKFCTQRLLSVSYGQVFKKGGASY